MPGSSEPLRGGPLGVDAHTPSKKMQPHDRLPCCDGEAHLHQTPATTEESRGVAPARKPRRRQVRHSRLDSLGRRELLLSPPGDAAKGRGAKGAGWL
jgi:hypothetical protein